MRVNLCMSVLLMAGCQCGTGIDQPDAGNGNMGRVNRPVILGESTKQPADNAVLKRGADCRHPFSVRVIDEDRDVLRAEWTIDGKSPRQRLKNITSPGEGGQVSFAFMVNGPELPSVGSHTVELKVADGELFDDGGVSRGSTSTTASWTVIAEDGSCQ